MAPPLPTITSKPPESRGLKEEAGEILKGIQTLRGQRGFQYKHPADFFHRALLKDALDLRAAGERNKAEMMLAELSKKTENALALYSLAEIKFEKYEEADKKGQKPGADSFLNETIPLIDRALALDSTLAEAWFSKFLINYACLPPNGERIKAAEDAFNRLKGISAEEEGIVRKASIPASQPATGEPVAAKTPETKAVARESAGPAPVSAEAKEKLSLWGLIHWACKELGEEERTEPMKGFFAHSKTPGVKYLPPEDLEQYMSLLKLIGVPDEEMRRLTKLKHKKPKEAVTVANIQLAQEMIPLMARKVCEELGKELPEWAKEGAEVGKYSVITLRGLIHWACKKLGEKKRADAMRQFFMSPRYHSAGKFLPAEDRERFRELLKLLEMPAKKVKALTVCRHVKPTKEQTKANVKLAQKMLSLMLGKAREGLEKSAPTPAGAKEKTSLRGLITWAYAQLEKEKRVNAIRTFFLHPHDHSAGRYLPKEDVERFKELLELLEMPPELIDQLTKCKHEEPKRKDTLRNIGLAKKMLPLMLEKAREERGMAPEEGKALAKVGKAPRVSLASLTKIACERLQKEGQKGFENPDNLAIMVSSTSNWEKYSGNAFAAFKRIRKELGLKPLSRGKRMEPRKDNHTIERLERLLFEMERVLNERGVVTPPGSEKAPGKVSLASLVREACKRNPEKGFGDPGSLATMLCESRDYWKMYGDEAFQTFNRIRGELGLELLSREGRAEAGKRKPVVEKLEGFIFEMEKILKERKGQAATMPAEEPAAPSVVSVPKGARTKIAMRGLVRWACKKLGKKERTDAMQLFFMHKHDHPIGRYLPPKDRERFRELLKLLGAHPSRIAALTACEHIEPRLAQTKANVKLARKMLPLMLGKAREKAERMPPRVVKKVGEQWREAPAGISLKSLVGSVCTGLSQEHLGDVVLRIQLEHNLIVYSEEAFQALNRIRRALGFPEFERRKQIPLTEKNRQRVENLEEIIFKMEKVLNEQMGAAAGTAPQEASRGAGAEAQAAPQAAAPEATGTEAVPQIAQAAETAGAVPAEAAPTQAASAKAEMPKEGLAGAIADAIRKSGLAAEIARGKHGELAGEELNKRVAEIEKRLLRSSYQVASSATIFEMMPEVVQRGINNLRAGAGLPEREVVPNGQGWGARADARAEFMARVLVSAGAVSKEDAEKARKEWKVQREREEAFSCIGIPFDHPSVLAVAKALFGENLDQQRRLGEPLVLAGANGTVVELLSFESETIGQIISRMNQKMDAEKNKKEAEKTGNADKIKEWDSEAKNAERVYARSCGAVARAFLTYAPNYDGLSPEDYKTLEGNIGAALQVVFARHVAEIAPRRPAQVTTPAPAPEAAPVAPPEIVKPKEWSPEWCAQGLSIIWQGLDGKRSLLDIFEGKHRPANADWNCQNPFDNFLAVQRFVKENTRKVITAIDGMINKLPAQQRVDIGDVPKVVAEMIASELIAKDEKCEEIGKHPKREELVGQMVQSLLYRYGDEEPEKWKPYGSVAARDFGGLYRGDGETAAPPAPGQIREEQKKVKEKLAATLWGFVSSIETKKVLTARDIDRAITAIENASEALGAGKTREYKDGLNEFRQKLKEEPKKVEPQELMRGFTKALRNIAKEMRGG